MKIFLSNAVLCLLITVLSACNVATDSLEKDNQPDKVELASEFLQAAQGDQCNTTAECQSTYGDTATDCANSQSSQSVCMCGDERCDAPPPFTPVPPEGDECNATSECKEIYGDQADDCFDSRSANSLCYCGGVACYEIDPDEGEPGDGDNDIPTGPSGYAFVANEGETINISSPVDLAYGANGEFVYLSNQTINITCSNATFGDPIPGTVKQCYAKAAANPTEPVDGTCEIGGELNKFGRTELVCQGLTADETDSKTFTDYRFNVTFTKGSQAFVIPGHFAADGKAANTSAEVGDKWRAYFTPPTTGTWSYSVSFREGNNVAVNTGANAGTAVEPFNGMTGTFSVGSIAATLPDMRARGLLQHLEGERYLRFSHDKTLFIEAGMDSPENIFGYSEFDNTVKYSNVASCKGILHDFEPHLDDWNAGDPTWKNGKGKSLIGLINYISSRGVNAVYMMGMTVNSDGCDAHPWTTYNNNGTEKSFDVSKLDQWEIAFRHMENKGLLIHYMTQETENDQLLNNGNLGLERKLYYREIISRFGHHPALQWNLGEENTNTPAQQKAFSNYIRSLDAYNKPIFMHTYPGETDRYDDLLGHSTFDGPTIQIGNIPQSSDVNSVYGKAKTWIDRSKTEGKPWVVTFTEASGAHAPRPFESVTKRQRVYWMWASVMSGGAGFEWYLKGSTGGAHAYDLAVENLREFDNYWQQTGHFARFFEEIVQRDKGIDLHDLSSRNALTSTTNDWVLADPGKAYLILLRDGGTTNVTLPDTNLYEVLWFNPRTGAQHIGDDIQGAGNRPIGSAPNQQSQDWVVLVTLKAEQPNNEGADYNEANGLVIIEAENTTSDLDLWQELTSISSYTGDGFIQFNGNTVINGPADSPLSYTFKINQGGVYHLHMRVARETVDGRTDVANDGYVRVEGDYTSPVRTPLNTLKTDTKFYGGAHNSFVWASGNRLDRDHEKWPAVYEFKAGKTYTLVLSGRSKLFKVDRIVFRHADVAVGTAQNLSRSETK